MTTPNEVLTALTNAEASLKDALHKTTLFAAEQGASSEVWKAREHLAKGRIDKAIEILIGAIRAS